MRMFTYMHHKSLQVQPSPIGYIAMAVALLGQGDLEGAICTFALAFHDCEPHDIRFLLLLKLILMFESGNKEEAITRVLGAMYLKKGTLRTTNNVLPYRRSRSYVLCLYFLVNLILWKDIWDGASSGLDIVAQQRLCEHLYTEERTAEAVEILLNVMRTSGRGVPEKRGNRRVDHFTKKCATTLEHVGDEALRSAKLDDAIIQYSAALSLSLPNPAGLLIKRSGVLAAKGLWEDALQDANEAVEADPSDPWGYKAKHMALHGAKDMTKRSTLLKLRKDYVSPSETIAAIDPIDGPIFKELVSSMTREVDNGRILRVVTSFFGYVMFSHVRQGNETSFQDVNEVKSVWSLPETPLNGKLRDFCKETRRLGYNWAWSDTCCIDKTTSSVLSQSLTSMYKWYADSAATFVFLADVAHPSKPGDLACSLWMTQAWTLQALLAPKVIIFYDSEWKPYLGNTGENHKQSADIMQELAEAIKMPRETIVTFSPDNLGVREKLRLASTRNAIVEEDVAYSLIGIFKSDIRPQYDEGADALGRLLEEVVDHSGEISVLAWSGKSSSYNSCLPASVSVYSQTPFNPPLLEGEAMKTCITELRSSKLSQQEALNIYKQIKSLQPARFAARRLHLPCIIFPVRGLSIQRGNENVYHAKVSGLGNVEFTATDDLPLDKRQKIVFAHPWIHHILGQSSEVAWGGDSDSDFDSDSDYNICSDENQALQMIARLGQPFNALLLAQQQNRGYKRLAAKTEIIVPGLGTAITSKNIRVKVLEIL
ncbi:hypothetical protein EDC04DRAFT_2599781 [Pisolithus marmoratus]|nr:hypothetical protein EDC04DRAFT_2599781 [Pisolithus marmoratus]